MLQKGKKTTIFPVIFILITLLTGKEKEIFKLIQDWMNLWARLAIVPNWYTQFSTRRRIFAIMGLCLMDSTIRQFLGDNCREGKITGLMTGFKQSLTRIRIQIPLKTNREFLSLCHKEKHFRQKIHPKPKRSTNRQKILLYRSQNRTRAANKQTGAANTTCTAAQTSPTKGRSNTGALG